MRSTGRTAARQRLCGVRDGGGEASILNVMVGEPFKEGTRGGHGHLRHLCRQLCQELMLTSGDTQG